MSGELVKLALADAAVISEIAQCLPKSGGA